MGKMEELVAMQVKLKLRECRKPVMRKRTSFFPFLDMDGIREKNRFYYKSGQFVKPLYILFHYCIAGAV